MPKSDAGPTRSRVASFRRIVYRYFDHHGRDLPWRHTSNPYHILVSEIMLQQTQVDRVSGRYHRFIDEFPDLETLAGATTHALLTAWSGLGYNRRALSLQRCAAEILDRFSGIIPSAPDALATLPGIGKATAASIAAFAFNRPTVFIETNIRAVYLHHFFADCGGITDSELLPLVECTLDRRRPARWYSALMDYGVHLKKRFGNPSRRSAHHVGQSRFQGSDRQVRGAILRLLLEGGARTEEELIGLLGVEPHRASGIIARLVDERFLGRNDSQLCIAP